MKTYQNEDGGFGNGIEPDFWLPNSSPMATWMAGQILMEIGADRNEPMVQSMISYLQNTIHIETGMWDSVLPENNEYPHAPWWHWQENVQENWMFNPSAELAAFLIHWSYEESETAEIGWIATCKAVDHLMSRSGMDRHEIKNYQQLIKIAENKQPYFDTKVKYPLPIVSEKVLEIARNCIDRNVSTWTDGYKPLPLDFIDTPNHPLNHTFGSLIETNIHI